MVNRTLLCEKCLHIKKWDGLTPTSPVSPSSESARPGYDSEDCACSEQRAEWVVCQGEREARAKWGSC